MNPVKVFGTGVTYLGFGALFLMSIVGSISIDLVILMAISKIASRNRHHDGGGHSFLTGFLFGMMFSNNNHSNRGFYGDAFAMMAISPFLTGIAVILSIALGVPEVGVLLVAGWIGAFGILAAGVAIHALGEGLGSFATWLIERSQRVPSTVPAYRSAHDQQYDFDQQQTTSVFTEQQDQQSARTTYDPRLFPRYPAPAPTPSAPTKTQTWENTPPPPYYQDPYTTTP